VFGISFGKLLLLGVLVAAIWFGIRWLQGLGRDPAADSVRKPAPGPTPSSAKPSAAAREAPPAGGAEDLTKCPVCGTYVIRSAPRCGRADCPAALHG
jgi:hypothetical protein